jgi:UDP-glucose 4-epimerase
VGSEVTAFGHGTWSPDELRRWGVATWHDTDVTLAALLADGGEPEMLVHCAGSGRVALSLERPLDDFQSNVDTTAAALEFVRRRTPNATILFISSAAVYGEATTGRLREDAPAAPVSPYGVHKYVAERLCASYAEHFGLRTLVLRLFSLYGPGLRKQLLWDACDRLTAGPSVFSGSGRELRDWLHVTDAAALVVTLAAAAVEQYSVFNGGTGEAVAVSEILAELSAALGTGPATFNGRPRAGDPPSLVADVTRAKSLGWRPSRDWREGVREYAAWYRSHT